MGGWIECLMGDSRRGRGVSRWSAVCLAVMLVAVTSGCVVHTDNMPPQSTVAQVDLERYMGQWYEIASLPNWFQKGCACTTAEYRLLDDYVEVKNTCRDGSSQGKVREALGKAWVVDGSSGARLEVSFFWPFKGDYWIIALDPDYQWALVGHPQRKYLWILSRSPKMDAKLVEALLAQARSLGYPVDQINMTDQTCQP